jgi:hypothetical protein
MIARGPLFAAMSVTGEGMRGILLSLGAAAIIGVCTSTLAHACDCSNCSAEHCQGKVQHPDFLWNPPRISGQSGEVEGSTQIEPLNKKVPSKVDVYGWDPKKKEPTR